MGHRIQVCAKPVGNANYFGIEMADRHTKCSIVPTREVINATSVIENLEFADYDSLEESCDHYAWLITQGVSRRVGQYQLDHDLD